MFSFKSIEKKVHFMTKKQSIFNGEIGQRFSLRKYRAIGLTSVALGSVWLGLAKTSDEAKADTTNGEPATEKVATDGAAGTADSSAANNASASNDSAAKTSAISTNTQAEVTSAKADAASIESDVSNNSAKANPAQANAAKADTNNIQNATRMQELNRNNVKVTNLDQGDEKSEYVVSKDAAPVTGDNQTKADDPHAAEPAKPGQKIITNAIKDYSDDLATNPQKYGFDKYTAQAVKDAHLTNSDFHQSVERQISTTLDGKDQSDLDLTQSGNLRRIVYVKTEGTSDTNHTDDPFNLNDGYPQVSASDWMLQIKDVNGKPIEDGTVLNNGVLQYEAMNSNSVKQLQNYSANNSGYNVDILDQNGNKIASGNEASLAWISKNLAVNANVDTNKLADNASLADKFHAVPFVNTKYQIAITTLTRQVNYVFHDKDDKDSVITDLGNNGSVTFKGLMDHQPTTNGKIGQAVDIASVINNTISKLTDDNGNVLYKLANPDDPNLSSYTFKADNPDVVIELAHNIFSNKDNKPDISDSTRDQDGNLVKAMTNVTANYNWNANSDTAEHTQNLQKYFEQSDYPQNSYEANYHFIRDYNYDPAAKRADGKRGVYTYGDWHLDDNKDYSNKGNSKVETSNMNALLHDGDVSDSVIIGYSHKGTSDSLMSKASWQGDNVSGKYQIDASDPYSLIGESFKNKTLVGEDGQAVESADPIKTINSTVTWTPNDRTVTYKFHDTTTGKDIDVPIIGKDGKTTGKTDEGSIPTGFDPTNPKSPVYGMDTGDTNLPKEVDLGTHKGSDGKWHYNTENSKPIDFKHKTSGDFDKDHIPDGIPVTKDDLDRTITASTEIVKPDGKTSNIDQSVEFERNGNYDYYTKKTSFTNWQVANQAKTTTDENGKVTTQKANFAIDPDAVDVDGSKSPNVTLDRVEAPTVDGYVSVGDIPAMTINADSSRRTGNKITYNANGQSLTVTYHDPFTGEDHDQTFVGKTGDSQKITLTLPKGTETMPDGENALKNNPNLKQNPDGTYTYTFTPDKKQSINIDIHHAYTKSDDQTQTVSRDITITVPGQTPQTIHQEATFTRPSYVDQATGQKVLERDYDPKDEDKWTLDPNAKTNTPDQIEVDSQGRVTFKGADVPQIKGYTSNINNIPSTPVTPDTKSAKVNVVYTANDLTGKIIYEDANHTPVGEGVFHGKTGETVDIDTSILENVPKNWDIDPKTNPQTEYTFKAYDPETDRVNPNKPITVQIVHHMEDAHAGEHGLTDKDFDRHVTRVINITKPDGTKTYPVTQAVHFTRTGKWDFAANDGKGAFVPDDWTVNGQKRDSYTFDEIDAPVIIGYGTNTNAPKIKVGPDSESSTINIHYIKGAHNSSLIYVDDDNDGSQVGSNVQIGGATGDSINLTQYTKGSYIPAHYDFKSIEEQAGYSNLDPVTDSYTFSGQDSQNGQIIIHLGHHMDNYNITDPSDPNYQKQHVDLTRQVNFADASQDKIEHLHFDRSAKKDAVTGQIIYGDWSNGGKGSFSDTEIPTKPGYDTIAKDDNARAIANKLTTKDGKTILKGYNVDINGLSDDQIAALGKTTNVTINYAPQDQKVVYQFIDDDEKGNNVGKGIEVDSKTDQAKQVSLRIPDNYKLADGQQLPTSFGFSYDALKNLGDGHVIQIHLVHQVGIPKGSDVDPDTGKTVNEMTHKTVHRDIEFIDPITNATTDQDQSTTFTTKAHKDMVTGKITYDGWDTTDPKNPKIKRDGWSDHGSHTLPGVTGSQVDGYKAPSVDPVVVHPDTPDSKVKAPDYIATKGQRTIHYIDPDTGKEVGHTTVNGKPGKELPVPKDKNGNPQGLPDGWTPSGDLPDKITTIPTHLDQDPNDTKDKITSNVKHVTVTIEPDKDGHDKVTKSDDPSSVGKDAKPGDIIPKTNSKHLDYDPKDLVKDVTRTIDLTLPDGSKKSITQTVEFKRSITIDAVTGKTTLSDWTPMDPDKDKFDPITVDKGNDKGDNTKLPGIDDYTPHVFDNKGNEIEMPIGKDGKPIVTIPGVNNVSIDYNDKDNGYHVVYELTKTSIYIDPDHPLNPGDIIPGTHIPAPDGLDYDHLHKSIDRVINFEMLDGTESVTQSVKAKRGATIDLKTMKITYDPWQVVGKDSFDKVTVPQVDGYKASQSVIPGVEHVDPNTDYDTVINIKYTKSTDNNGDNDSNSGGNGNGYIDSGNGFGNAGNATGNNGQNNGNKNQNGNTNSNNDLQKQIDELRHRVDQLAKKIDKLAKRRVGNNNGKGKHGFNGRGLRLGHGYGFGNGSGYDNGYGSGSGYDNSYGSGSGYGNGYGNSSGYSNGYGNGFGLGYGVMPSGYVTNGYNNANAIDQAAANRYGNELPQTGSESNIALSMLGILTFLALGVSAAAASTVGASKKRKHE